MHSTTVWRKKNGVHSHNYYSTAEFVKKQLAIMKVEGIATKAELIRKLVLQEYNRLKKEEVKL